MTELVADHHVEQQRLEQDAEERRKRGVTFRELTQEWLVYLEREKGAKPSTLLDYPWMLAELGQPHRRGTGKSPGLLMAALGDRPSAGITTREAADFLRELDSRGCKPRSVNRYRQLISAAWNYAMRDDTYGLELNPATGTTKRREPPAAVLDLYEPEDVEQLARAAELGAHRVPRAAAVSDEELAARGSRTRRTPRSIASLLTRDCGSASCWPCGGRRRSQGPPADRSSGVQRRRGRPDEEPAGAVCAAGRRRSPALASLQERMDFLSGEDYVFCNRLGRPLDGAVLRRLSKRTAAAAGLRVVRFHALRHGAGSLVARQADPRWVQGFLGHSKITTTERYLHAKARPEDVQRLNRAFATALTDTDTGRSAPDSAS